MIITPPQCLPVQPPAPLRLFIIEDSQAVRELIIEHLSDIRGIEFAGFSETENDALQQLRHAIFDVVLFDIELRQGNGISILRSMAAAPTLPQSLKIIFSNNVSTAYRQIGAQYGVHHFFDKTSDLPKLHALLYRVSLGLTKVREAPEYSPGSRAHTP